MPLTMASACSCLLQQFSLRQQGGNKGEGDEDTLVSHMGIMIPWAPASSALFIIHASPAGILTIGDAPAAAIAPTARYISLSAMFPCSQSTNTHYRDMSV
jgi:hypothetical protein